MKQGSDTVIGNRKGGTWYGRPEDIISFKTKTGI